MPHAYRDGVLEKMVRDVPDVERERSAGHVERDLVHPFVQSKHAGRVHRTDRTGHRRRRQVILRAVH